jgi:hypothetical protein
LELFVSLGGRAAASMRCNTVHDVRAQTANFERETARTTTTEHYVVDEQALSSELRCVVGVIAACASVGLPE